MQNAMTIRPSSLRNTTSGEDAVGLLLEQKQTNNSWMKHAWYKLHPSFWQILSFDSVLIHDL